MFCKKGLLQMAGVSLSVLCCPVLHKVVQY